MYKCKIVFLLPVLVLFILSCSDSPSPVGPNTATVQFSFQETTLIQKSNLDISDAREIVISILQIDGTPVHTDLVMGLINFNGYLITEPISLEVGSYNLSKFIVLDETNSAIYATPLSGSELAYAVEHPLPMQFSIEEDQVNQIVPEVISTAGQTPDQFGYLSFRFVEVEVFDFLIAAFIYDSEARNWDLTAANLKIQADGAVVYNYPFTNSTSTISVKDGLDNYQLIVSKAGYEDVIKSFSNAELRSHVDNPVVILFYSSPVLWNKLESEECIENSEIGPDGFVYGSGISFLPGKFGNGFHSGSNNTGPNFGLWEEINQDYNIKGTVEFWWKPARNYGEIGSPDQLFVSGVYEQPWVLPFQLMYRWRESDPEMGGFEFSVYGGDTNFAYRTGKVVPFMEGELVHVAFVWDMAGLPEDSEANYGVYVNGTYFSLTNVYSPEEPVTELMLKPVGAYFSMGYYTADSNNQNQGVIDNVKIFDYAKADFSDRSVE